VVKEYIYIYIYIYSYKYYVLLQVDKSSVGGKKTTNKSSTKNMGNFHFVVTQSWQAIPHFKPNTLGFNYIHVILVRYWTHYFWVHPITEHKCMWVWHTFGFSYMFSSSKCRSNKISDPTSLSSATCWAQVQMDLARCHT
jgi:hypothetical protein